MSIILFVWNVSFGSNYSKHDEYKAYTKTVVPVGRSGVDGELDSTVIYLASPKSSYVTCQAIAVDGGYTCI